MNISKEEKKRLDKTLVKLLEATQRSLVSLRKNNLDDLCKDMDCLATSINAFMLQAGDNTTLYDGR